MLVKYKRSLCHFTALLLLQMVSSHIVGEKGELTELKKLCDYAYTCFHDTILICGKSVNEARTFMDLCDLYEYSCENNMGTSGTIHHCHAQIRKMWVLSPKIKKNEQEHPT